MTRSSSSKSVSFCPCANPIVRNYVTEKGRVELIYHSHLFLHKQIFCWKLLNDAAITNGRTHTRIVSSQCFGADRQKLRTVIPQIKTSAFDFSKQPRVNQEHTTKDGHKPFDRLATSKVAFSPHSLGVVNRKTVGTSCQISTTYWLFISIVNLQSILHWLPQHTLCCIGDI